MLQIITGKFFKKEELYKTPRKAVFFSNYNWIEPIQTCIGTLEPVDHGGGVSTWVFSYLNQIEKQGGKFSIVRVGDEEIVEQFRLLCLFGLRAYFAPQRHEIEHYCRQTQAGVTDGSVPSQMVPRYFEAGLNGKGDECVSFARMVEKTLSLKRDQYLGVMAALRTFCSALEATSTSVDLAYSMLVYALESLAQRFDAYEPIWSDYDDKVRNSLDELMGGVSSQTAQGIRATLLQSAHLKLLKRFVLFIEDYTEDSYFTQGLEGVKSPLRKLEFSRAVKHAYTMRSGYVHELKPIVSQLRVPTISQYDVFRWDKEPYLTLSGLVRLTSHVLCNFIARGESVAKEDINWRSQLPGIITLKVSPEYWIHQVESFTPESSHQMYSAFLDHLLTSARAKKPLVDMSSVMERIERLTSGTKETHKITMLCLYWVYNASLMKDLRRPNWDKFLKPYENLLDKCRIDTVAARLMLGGKLEWNFTECSSCYEDYHRTRFSKSALELPIILEIAFIAEIANKALAERNREQHGAYLDQAVLNSPGMADVQELLGKARTTGQSVDVEELLFGNLKVASEEQASSKS